MSHYYDENQYAQSNRKEISFRFWCLDYTFVLDNGIFSKNRLDSGTRILLDSLKDLELGNEILDLGCGAGFIGIILKGSNPQYHLTLSDINERALELTKLNADKNQVKVNVLKSDGFNNIHGQFDAIITNPPIRCGKAVIYKMFDDAKDHLNPNGKLVLVIRRQHGAESSIKHLETVYGNCEIVDRDKGFYVLMARK